VPSRLDTLSPPATQHRPSAASAMRIHPNRIFSPANNAEDEDGPALGSSARMRRESLASLGTAYG
jgi:hypothetical protein